MYRNICVLGLFAIFMSALSTPIPDDELNEDTYEVTDKHQEQCLKELRSGSDAADINANENNSESRLSFQCLQLCYGKKKELLDDDGAFIPLTIIGNNDADNTTIEWYNSCSNIEGANSCDRASKTFDCLIPKLGITK